MFGTVFNYVALRLLGEDREDNALAKGRKWILDHAGAVATPSWGKFWLAVCHFPIIFILEMMGSRFMNFSSFNFGSYRFGDPHSFFLDPNPNRSMIGSFIY